jgi:UDPglucose--hexose-1-phosphate uridylyltransferase
VSLIKKVSGTLFDGRDIFYFDDASSNLPSTRNKDLRPTDQRPPLAELRHDPLTNEWISVAAHRHTRAFLPPSHECPLCPATETYLSEIPDNFDVAVFENKNPSFGASSGITEEVSTGQREAFGATRPSVGRCEVVVFSPEHTGSLGTMPVERVETVLYALADRTAAISSLPGVKQIFPFENRGQEIGVTLHHPHGQIYAYPFVTPKTQKLLESISSRGDSFFQELLDFERGSNRTVIESDSFTAYVPFAARWPIEVHLLPHRQVGNHSELTDAERAELAEVYSKLLGAFENLYPTPTPYISAWHQAPLVDAGKNVRLQLQLTSPRRAADRLKYLAGSESAMGAFIADIPAETIAGQLKDVLK